MGLRPHEPWERGSATRAPDALEPVLAWRVWFVKRCEDGRHRLDSVIHHCEWPTRHELSAACLTTRGAVAKRHFAPLRQCQCGVYGAATLERLDNYLGQGLGPAPRLQVVGIVRLWGRVLVHEHGWRASHAYPARLWLARSNVRDEPTSNWEDIAFDLTDYGVPIEILDHGHPPHVLGALRASEHALHRAPGRRAA
jgi:hypothetical protein